MLPKSSLENAYEYLKKQADENGEWYVIVHPKIWNGYWFVERHIPFLRWLGRKLHSRRIYWLGLQIVWVEGMKDWK
jgi:hypothetical protein